MRRFDVTHSVNMTTRVDLLLAAYEASLREIRGQKVISTWSVWFDEWNEAHTCSPVVLQLGSGYLELWPIYVCEFSLSWNTIDLSKPPFVWLRQPQSGTRWVNSYEPLLQDTRDKIIGDVGLLTVNNTCNGIRFQIGDSSLVIQNVLDELVISRSAVGSIVERRIE